MSIQSSIAAEYHLDVLHIALTKELAFLTKLSEDYDLLNISDAKLMLIPNLTNPGDHYEI